MSNFADVTFPEDIFWKFPSSLQTPLQRKYYHHSFYIFYCDEKSWTCCTHTNSQRNDTSLHTAAPHQPLCTVTWTGVGVCLAFPPANSTTTVGVQGRVTANRPISPSQNAVQVFSLSSEPSSRTANKFPVKKTDLDSQSSLPVIMRAFLVSGIFLVSFTLIRLSLSSC